MRTGNPCIALNAWIVPSDYPAILHLAHPCAR